MNINDIILKNKQNVKQIIRLITNEENEDLEQEVFIRVWKKKNQYKEKGCLKAWINTIAKNLSKDYLKSAYKKHQSYNSTDEHINQLKDNTQSFENKLIQKNRKKIIIKAIDSLKPKYKEVIILCEMKGYSYEMASKELNVPLGTIKSRIYNGKKYLYEKLKDLI